MCTCALLFQILHRTVWYLRCDAAPLSAKAGQFCVRIVSGRKKYDHISDVVQDLRWLRADQLVSCHTLCLLKRVMLTGQPGAMLTVLLTMRMIPDNLTS